MLSLIFRTTETLAQILYLYKLYINASYLFVGVVQALQSCAKSPDSAHHDYKFEQLANQVG